MKSLLKVAPSSSINLDICMFFIIRKVDLIQWVIYLYTSSISTIFTKFSSKHFPIFVVMESFMLLEVLV